MTKQTFLRGTLILIVAGMITRLLGFLNRIVVARLMGEEGVGLYMMALPSLFLLITLTQIGLPIAIAKRVAEAKAQNNDEKIKRILIYSIFIITCSSIAFSSAMFLLTPIIARYLMTDIRTLYPLLAVIPSVPIIAFTSIIKGYFQGMHNLKPQSFAIVIEQIVRISTIFLLIQVLLPFGIEYAATGAMLSIFVGEIASFLYLLLAFKKQKEIRLREQFFSYLHKGKQVRKELFSIAIPNTGSRLISSFSSFLEPILVSQSLAIAGYSIAQSTRQYGELTGYAMPLLFLPTFITNSISIALVPSISEADAQGNKQLIHHRIHQSVRISFASGALATVIFTLFATPILTYMYDTTSANKFIIFMAPFFLFLYIQAPLQATLFALDLAKHAMKNSFIGSVCKFILLIVFASQPKIGIMGVAIAINTSIVLITLLHVRVLYKTIHFKLKVQDLMKMILLIMGTVAWSLIVRQLFYSPSLSIISFVGQVILISIFYIFLLLILKIITRDEMAQIPILRNLFKI